MSASVRAAFPKEQEDGRFVRQGDVFRDWVTGDKHSGYPAEAGRYHLYISWACPWAHRTAIVRTLKGLERAVGISIVDPIRDDRGWAFGPEFPDPINGFEFLSEAYLATDPNYEGRFTVPVLWDTVTQRIVSNSDDDLMRILGQEFESFAQKQVDLYPTPLREEIDRLNEAIYEQVNNGVYRAGFATTQASYEEAVRDVFAMLDQLDQRLSERRFLFGDHPLETDWRLFVTLIRFDPVYFGHFKCNFREIRDYPNLSGYLRDLYQVPGIAETVNFDHIKRHYYCTHDSINPTRIVPLGPLQDLLAPSGRESLSGNTGLLA